MPAAPSSFLLLRIAFALLALAHSAAASGGEGTDAPVACYTAGSLGQCPEGVYKELCGDTLAQARRGKVYSEAELRFATAPASRGDWGQASRSGWALEYDLLPRMEAEQLNGLLLDDAAVEALGRAVRANGGIYRGSLVIGGANVTTLAPLAGLREVRGSLQLMRTAVPTLRGLESLAAIGGDLEISGCDALETLEGLQGLHAVGFDVEIWYNEGLRDISPLLNLESIGGRLEVWRNKELDSLQGLGSVKRIGEDLVINSENLNLSGLRATEKPFLKETGILHYKWS
mmetsp:Transcript_14941/g.37864  ORF Transcript_14941/g.37864 Transcript_14941/m.37864 type:complete len:287 (-) Transcript_14941:875-1735(-)